MPDTNRSVLVADGQLRGELALAGDLTLGGSFVGVLTVGGELEIAAGGLVTGPVEAGSLVLRGEIEGDVHVRGRLELKAGATLVGSLSCGSLTIDAGAKLRGEVTIGDCEAAAAEDLEIVLPVPLPSESYSEGEFDATFEVELNLGEIIAASQPFASESVTQPDKGEPAEDAAAADAAPLPEIRIGTAALQSALLRRRTKVLVGATAKPSVAVVAS